MDNGNVTLKEVTERFLAIEEELGLLNRRIAGEPFWELIRSVVRRKILGEMGMYSKKEAPRIQGIGYLARVALHVIANSLFRNPYLAGHADLLFFGMHRRRLLEDGFWHDIYCDSLIEQLEKEGVRCLMIERPPFGRPIAGPAKTRRLSYYDVIEVFALLARRLGFARVRFSAADRAFLDTLQERINGEFGTSVNILLHAKQALEVEKSLLPFYGALLSRVAPKAVVVVNSAGHIQLIKACRERGIPLIELQQGALHQYLLEGPHTGGSGRKEYVPDFFFAYGDFWKQFVSLPPERILSVGFPYYDMESRKYRGVPRKNSQILFLSQPTTGRLISRLAIELARELGDEWRIVYKLHPAEEADWRIRYPSLIDPLIIVTTDRDKPLYELLAESAAQAGVNSTALYEGLGFGLPTYLIEAPGVETMDALLEAGSARLVSSAAELRALLFKPKRQEQVEDEGFFRKDSLERMVKFTREIASL